MIAVVTLQSMLFPICRCTYGSCDNSLLVGAREYRCCKEVAEAIGKFTFIGLDAGCIVEHQDYSHLTHCAVLTEVAPLLRDKNGKRYKKQTGATENE
jgi:hypothetical protein